MMEVRDGGCRLEQYSRLVLWIGRSLCFRTETGLGYVFVQKVLEDYLPPDRPSFSDGESSSLFYPLGSFEIRVLEKYMCCALSR